MYKNMIKIQTKEVSKMKYKSNDIRKQIDKLKKLISIDAESKEIKSVQAKLNQMLERYLAKI